MLRAGLLLLILASAVPSVAAITDGEPEVLKRADKWVVDYDENACHLTTGFGAGEGRVLMRFTHYQPGDGFDVSLYGKRMQSPAPRQGLHLYFGTKDSAIDLEGMNGTAGDLPVTVVGGVRLDGWKASKVGETGPVITPEQENATTQMTVALQGKPPFRLEFGSLGKPFLLMRDCWSTLVQHWGYDPEVQSSLSRKLEPVTPPGSWAKNDDYPMDAMRGGIGGQVRFRLDVDTAGNVTSCHILAVTQPYDFGALTCKLVSKRARFHPALDAKGQPVASFFVSRFMWLI